MPEENLVPRLVQRHSAAPMRMSHTLPRRVMLALAGVGLDIRPLARRFRDAILRPHRAEIAVRLAEMDRAQTILRADLQRQQADLHRAQADLEAAYAGLHQRVGSLHDGVQHVPQVIEDHTAVLRQQLASLEQTLVETCAELHQRSFLLEQFVTGTAAARPPGAVQAVARTPDPAVAVVLPTYNRAVYLSDAVASVQAQTFPHWELIIVDDGSTDGTPAVVHPLLVDRRIRYLQQPKANGSAARNRGIAATDAPLIAYLDSDNLWYPEFLARTVDCLATETDVDLVYGALVSDLHGLDRRCILWREFDRTKLLKENYIDTNVIVHRRALVARYGGWNTSLERLVDWDLVLRYTQHRPARALNVLAARYRACDDQRVTLTARRWPAEVAVCRSWFPPTTPARRPRVLYVVWHYPQLSETYAETELRCLRSWGVHVEVWCTSAGVSLYPIDVPVHRSNLTDAIAAVRPDIIHIHWLSFAHTQQAELAASGLPVTLRLHGFDVTPESLAHWLAHDWVSAVYAYPAQIAAGSLADERVKPMPVGFETALFQPAVRKDRRMVLRTSAALPSKQLKLFLELAIRLPEYRFVLAAVTCHNAEACADDLRAQHAAMQSPAELVFDVPREQVAELVAQAGIYVHTLVPPGQTGATPVGQPISIAEAMATGCYCLVRDLPELAAMVGNGGTTYRDLDELVALIRATQDWSDAVWQAVQDRAIERAFEHHADTMVFRTLFNDWMALSEPHGPAAPAPQPAAEPVTPPA